MLTLALLATADAASVKKTSTDDLINELRAGAKSSRRVDCARELGLRKATEAIGALTEVCGISENDVCSEAMLSLEAIGTDDGWASLQSILEYPSELDVGLRTQASDLLREHDAARWDDSAPRLVARYRTLEPRFVQPTLVTVGQRNLAHLADEAAWIAQDAGADREVRLAALDLAEQWREPRLFRAYLSLVRDPDRELRVRCIRGLDRPDLPASEVVPLLMAAAAKDPEGAVRAAALDGLRNWTHPQLKQMLYDHMENERHPLVWAEVLELSFVLADDDSVEPFGEAIRNRTFQEMDDLARMIQALVELGDTDSVTPIRAVEQKYQGTHTAELCRDALEWLIQKPEEREGDPPMVFSSSKIDYRVWEPGSAEVSVPKLPCALGAGDVLTCN